MTGARAQLVSLAGGLALVAVTPTLVAGDWPMFRGNAALTGVASETLARSLHVRWKLVSEEAFTSSAAIVKNMVFVGCDDGRLYALDLKTGELRWKFSTGQAPLE